MDGSQRVIESLAQKVAETYTGLTEKLSEVRIEFFEEPVKYTKDALKGIARDYWDLGLAVGGAVIASNFGNNLIMNYFDDTFYRDIADVVGVTMWLGGTNIPIVTHFRSKSVRGATRGMRNFLTGYAGLMFLGTQEGTNPAMGVFSVAATVYLCFSYRKIEGIHKRIKELKQHYPQGV